MQSKLASYFLLSIQNINDCQFSINKKTNALLNLISHRSKIDKMYLYKKQNINYYLKSVNLKHFHDPKAFIKYLNDMDDIRKNIGEHNLNRNTKY